MSNMTFKERCTVAVECLPNAPYRTMLANLLDEMLAALAQPAAQPTNCRHCGGPETVLCGGQCKPAAQQEPEKWRASFTKFKAVYDSYVKYNSSYYSSLSDALNTFVGECSSFAATTSTQQEPAGEPVAHLYIGGSYGNELQDWEIDSEQGGLDRLNEDAYKQGKELKLPLYTRPAVPLTDEQIIKWIESGEYNVTTNDWASHIAFARAIEAAHKVGGTT